MNREQFYQWRDEIQRQLGISKAQSMGLALFGLGVIWAERSTTSKVAERLGALWGTMASIERRLQRVLSNPKMDMERIGKRWSRWVLSHFDSLEMVLLVDETKLGEHLSVMMVGLAYQGRCIPLAWRCYHVRAYPPEGQVNLIAALLRTVKAELPEGSRPIVQADRGIGTSPALIRVIQRLGWRYLFRVQNTTKLCTYRGQEFMLGQQASGWSACGYAFKKRGHVRAYAFVHREFPHAERWCLLTNDPSLAPRDYALRSWQEQAFKDFKSGGWHWHNSHVWQPEHAQRLLLVLALAYAWMLTLGTLVAYAQHGLPTHRSSGKRRFFSIFRQGLRYFWDCLYRQLLVCPRLFFAPDKLLT
jgi:hypothetical protein